jgi:MFS family permease
MVIKKDSEIVKKKKKIARDHSIKEGIFAAAHSAFGTSYVSPFAIAINSSNSMVALLSSISGLLGPISQLTSPKLLKKNSRKKLLSKAILIESLMWIPFIFTAILFYQGILIGYLPFFLLAFFAISTIAINIGIPAWYSWIGDLVDDKHRGRWFAKRNLIIGFVIATLTIISSFFLDYFKKQELAMFGFAILFFLAFIFRMLAYGAIKTQYEPKLLRTKKKASSFFKFVIDAPKTNFGRFAIFKALLTFTASISAPLLAVYLLRHLEFSYTTYMIVTMAGTLFSLFVIELWGKFSDKYGNYRTLILTSIAIPTIPILWILIPSPIYMILVPALIGGIAWAGFNLSATNFFYDNVTAEKRSTKISYYNLLNGIGIFLGASLGAFLIGVIKTSFIEPIILIFIIGSILRMIVVFIFLPKIKEIRKTKKFDSKRVLKHIIFKEAKPTISEEVHEIMSIKKYLEVH